MLRTAQKQTDENKGVRLMSDLKRLLGYLERHWLGVTIVILAMAAATVLEMSPAALLRSIIDIALPERDLLLLAKLSLAFVGVAVLKGIILYVQWYTSELIGQSNISTKAGYSRPPSNPASVILFDHGNRAGMARLTSDIDSVQNFIDGAACSW